MIKKNTILAIIALATFSIGNTDALAQNIKKDKVPSSKPAVVLGTDHEEVQTNTIEGQLQKLVTDTKLASSDTSFIITSEHVSSISGIHHMYFRQSINGIEVTGTESSLHIGKNGSVIKSDVRFIKEVSSKLNSNIPSLSAKQAILSVGQQMSYSFSNLIEQENLNTVNKAAIFSGAGVSQRDIPVKLVNYFVEGKGILLAWELSIQEKNSSDWWDFRVDAVSGKIIDKYNIMVQCVTECAHTHDTNENCEEEESTDTIAAIFPQEENMMVGSYRVYPIPVESPYFGDRQLVSNPDNAAASPFGWHDTNGVAGSEFTDTRGNNVDAHDDISNNNSPGARASGGGGLAFDFAFDATITNPTTGLDPMPSFSTGTRSLDAAITNTFYWSNIIHDVMWQYGFDEDSGNFQETNYDLNGNGGGVGSDSVDADVQDGSGTCNANFGTPADGGNPTMQMYACGTSDGDYDNLVIVHEYGHGISNRLTGGAGTGACLNNDEQMGEGWSDFYGVMLTMDASNFSDDRTVGTYLFVQGPNGAGIRNAPYSKDFAVNNQTYDDIISTSGPHPLGSIWATMLYDMAQDLITQYGFDADLYNGTGGNNIALALVTEGLKLQGCSPGFVSGRDGILAADQALYAGANQCLIWEAFARRGLGFSASQGSTNSRTDGSEAFDLPPGTGSLAASIDEVCITSGIQSGLGGGTPTGGTYSGVGITDDGNGTTFTLDPSVAGVGNVTVNYNVVDACSGGGSSDYTDSITITDGMPALTCNAATVTLDGTGSATVTWPEVVSNSIPGGYTYASGISYSPENMTGTATVTLGDDAGTSALPLGFNFDFYGVTYTNFYIASNGFVSFTGNGMTGAASYTPTAIPNAAIPNGMIAGVWDDLSPNQGGTISYGSFGSAPNRYMVVEFDAVPLYNATETVTFQVKMFESSNTIEVHFIDVENNGGTRTFGLENADGSEAITDPLTNAGNWTGALEASRFIPTTPSMADNCGNGVTVSLSEDTFTCADIGTNTITVTADDGNGGVSTCMAVVTVVGPTSTYTTAGGWDVVPDAGRQVVFADDYVSNTNGGSIVACACEVAATATVTVSPDEHLDIFGNITVDGTLIIEHTGSVVQRDDTATVTNNGTINVEVTSPILRKRDFMVMGSPMDVEARTGVWNSAFLVLDFHSDLFIPHPDVPAGGTNFADDNGNFYQTYTGGVTPGEAYVVRPQNGYNDPSVPPAGRTFDFTYELGTLNNGVVEFTNQNNGPTDNPDGTPNMIANPYASAIDADQFMTDNPGISELYYWEHLTQPGAPLPVSNLRYDMDDFSYYNGTMGIPAANDLTMSHVPNSVISTAQGFGVRTTGAAGTTGTITFNNGQRLTSGNTTLRRPEVPAETLLLEVRELTYNLGAYAGVAFKDGATAEFDEGMDSQRLATVVSLYSHLDDGSEELGIQTRGAFDASMQIPMGFATQIDETLSYKISLKDIEGVNLEEVDVFLLDHQTNSVQNLKEDSYAFTSTEGSYSNRFTLYFESLLGTDTVSLDSIAVYPNPADEVLNIVSPSTVIESVEIHDLRGRKVQEVNGITATSHSLDISELNTAMYFVTITTNQGSITKRIIKE